MTDEHENPDGTDVLTLQELIRARMDERGWSYGYLERQANRTTGVGLSRSRWQQLGTARRMTEFPEPATLQHIADVLELDITTVLLATGASLEMQVRPRGSMFGQLLPAGVDELSQRMRDGLLTITRAAVAEHLASSGDENDHTERDFTLEWNRTRPAQLRNSEARSGDSTA